MPRGAVTAYVRVPAAEEPLALAVLERHGFYAVHDDGDPDRPPGTSDLYVSRHYGMTNPDQVTIQLHHGRIAKVLSAAGITAEDRNGGVVWGEDIPPEEIVPALYARTSEPSGFTVRARDQAEAESRLTLLSQTLGVDRKDLTFDLPAHWR
jgi:hypothetical protein